MKHTNNKQHHIKRNGEAGLTLIELMMAAGVVLIGIVMAMSAIVTISQTSAANQDATVARSHLVTVAEDLRNLDLESIGTYTAPAMEGLGAFETVTINLVEAGGAQVAVPVANDYDLDALPNPLEVRITVTWRTAAGRVQSQTLTSYVRR